MILINVLAKTCVLWVGHPTKPQKASKLRHCHNVYCVPFPFCKRYLQNVDFLLCDVLRKMQGWDRYMMTHSLILITRANQSLLSGEAESK